MAITVADFAAAVEFYHRRLGLPIRMSWDEPTGSGVVLEAGVATIEIISTDQADHIDQVEVGSRVAGPIRLALEVADSSVTAAELVAAGAVHLGGPVLTPWGDRNARIRAPEGTQLTLFTVTDAEGDTLPR